MFRPLKKYLLLPYKVREDEYFVATTYTNSCVLVFSNYGQRKHLSTIPIDTLITKKFHNIMVLLHMPLTDNNCFPQVFDNGIEFAVVILGIIQVCLTL